MRKIAIWFVGSLAALAAAVVIAITVIPGIILEWALEDFGQDTTSTQVLIDEVEGSIWRGQFVIGDLKVRNPEAYSEDWLFTAEDAKVSMNPWSLFTDNVVIHDLEIDRPSISYVVTKDGSNFDALGDDDSKKKDDDKDGKTLLIESFTMTNAVLKADLKGINPVDTTLDKLSVQDAGKKDGKAVKDIAQELKAAAMDKVFSAEIFSLIGDALDDDDPVMKTLHKGGKQYRDSLSEESLKNFEKYGDD